MEAILHLEEFSSLPQSLHTGEHVFFLKANDACATRWLHFSAVVQRGLSWVRTKISQKRAAK